MTQATKAVNPRDKVWERAFYRLLNQNEDAIRAHERGLYTGGAMSSELAREIEDTRRALVDMAR